MLNSHGLGAKPTTPPEVSPVVVWMLAIPHRWYVKPPFQSLEVNHEEVVRRPYMVFHHRKGEGRLTKDAARVKDGEPRQNALLNSTPYSKYGKGGKAYRNKGRNRFKTGRRQR